MKINIIIPSFSKVPSGGNKMMYEYANRLTAIGEDIMLYHAMSIPGLKPHRPAFYLYLKTVYWRHIKPNWFTLLKEVKVKSIFKINDRSIRDADITLFTQCTTAFSVSQLSKQKGARFNLIQGYETWIMEDIDMLHKSYCLPVTNIAVSDFIAKKIREVTGIMPYILYNSIDLNDFHISSDIKARLPHSISMLYSTLPAKGSQYGIEALRICKKKNKNLRATLFGVSDRPKGLDNWIIYIKSPDNLCYLYNSTAIFVAPSLKEGWGLTATEAMACGCALVCTETEGLTVFAHNGETALTTCVGNAEALAEKIMLLINDNNERIRIAKNGNEYIRQFNWDFAIKKLTDIFKNQAIYENQE